MIDAFTLFGYLLIESLLVQFGLYVLFWPTGLGKLMGLFKE